MVAEVGVSLFCRADLSTVGGVCSRTTESVSYVWSVCGGASRAVITSLFKKTSIIKHTLIISQKKRISKKNTYFLKSSIPVAMSDHKG